MKTGDKLSSFTERTAVEHQLLCGQESICFCDRKCGVHICYRMEPYPVSRQSLLPAL